MLLLYRSGWQWRSFDVWEQRHEAVVTGRRAQLWSVDVWASAFLRGLAYHARGLQPRDALPAVDKEDHGRQPVAHCQHAGVDTCWLNRQRRFYRLVVSNVCFKDWVRDSLCCAVSSHSCAFIWRLLNVEMFQPYMCQWLLYLRFHLEVSFIIRIVIQNSNILEENIFWRLPSHIYDVRLVAIVMSHKTNIDRLHVILHPGYVYFWDAKYVDCFSILHRNPSMSWSLKRS